MDVLKPDIIRIESRRYRAVCCVDRQPVETGEETYIEDDAYYYDEAESCAHEYDTIEETKQGFCDRVKNIPSFYFKFIIGKNSEKKKYLEHQTNTNITLPSRGCEGDIVIRGKDRKGVIAARAKIHTIIELNRKQQPAGHFLSLSVFSEEMQHNLEEFQKNVLKIQARGVDASIFQSPERLHLTLCLLTFLNDKELEEALPLIAEQTKMIKSKYFKDGPLHVCVRGVEYMNDDPSEVDVLYAKVSLPDASHRLQSFLDELVATLASSDFLKAQYDNVKIHITIMNTLFRERRREATASKNDSRKMQRVTFDARKILQEFSDFNFGEVKIESLDISVKGSFANDGEYKRAGRVLLA